MKQYFNKCTLYMFLWGGYYLQGTLYEKGSIISQGLLAIIMLWSLFLTVKVLLKNENTLFLKVLSFFILMMTVYALFYFLDNREIYLSGILSEKVGKISFLKAVYMSLLPIYVFYYYSKKEQLNKSIINVFSIFWLIIIIINYLKRQHEYQMLAIEVGYVDDVEMTNNVAYDFVALFPLLFFWNKKPLIQYFFTAVLFAFIISGMKRGAILIGAVCLIWFLYRSFITARGKQKFIIIVVTLLLIVVGVSYVVELYETSPYFQYRIEQTLEGSSSGRDVIFSSLWQHFKEDASLLHFLFGNGADYTVVIAGNFAHNDWLELLINQGLLGVILYAAYFIALLYTISKNRRNKEIYSMMTMIFVIMFASSLFSMSYNSLGLPIAVGLGYGMSQIQPKTEII